MIKPSSLSEWILILFGVALAVPEALSNSYSYGLLYVGSFPVYACEVVLLGVVGIAAAKVAQTGTWINRNTGAISLILISYVGSMIVVGVLGGNTERAIQDTRLLYAPLVVVSFEQIFRGKISKSRSVLLCSAIVVISSVVVVLLSSILYWTGAGTSELSRNEIINYSLYRNIKVGVAFLTCFAWVKYSLHKNTRYLALAGLVITLLFHLSYQEGGVGNYIWVLMALGITSVATINYLHGSVRRKTWHRMILTVGLLTALLWLIGGFEWLTDPVNEFQSTTSLYANNRVRLSQMAYAVDRIMESPVFGHGAAETYELQLSGAFRQAGAAIERPADSTFLSVGADYGVFGLILYLSLGISGVINTTYKGKTKSQALYIKEILIATQCTIIVVMILGQLFGTIGLAGRVSAMQYGVVLAITDAVE